MKQPRPKWMVPAIVVAAVIVVIIIGVVSRHGVDAIPVTTITVAPADMVVKLPENGVVDLPQTATIAAQSNGTVVEVVAHEGQRARGGDLLMRLDDRQAAAKVSADQAQAASAQATLDKAQQTAQIAGDTSIQTIAGAEQTLLAAQARLQGDINSKKEGQLSGAVAGASAFGVSGESQLIQQEQQLQAATSNLQTARETYSSDQALFKIDALPRQTLDRDQVALEQAQSAAGAAQRQYDLVKRQLTDNAAEFNNTIEADRRAVESAEAGVRQARVQARDDKTVDVRSAQAGLDSANAQMAIDQAQLDATHVRAPFDGVVQSIGTVQSSLGSGLVQLAIGDAVVPGQTLFTFAGTGPMVVKAQVDEQDIINVALGQHAFITGQDFPDRTLVGTVTRIAPVVVAQSQAGNAAKNVETTIALAQAYSFLRDGMSCDVDLVTGKAQHALTVPLSAVVDDGTKHHVFVIKGGVAHKTMVTEGIKNDTDVVIVSGLSKGDVVATTGVKDLKDGAKVQGTAASPTPSAGS
ncbi:MAG TPA: efflux RND transporter periplasmic adaptor subunit [Candidatus Eremiobacteraceae bacterium]